MSNQDPPQGATPDVGEAAPRTQRAPAPEFGASGVAEETGAVAPCRGRCRAPELVASSVTPATGEPARCTPSSNEMLRALYAAPAVRVRAQGAGLPPVVLGPADPPGNWPRLEPLPKHYEHSPEDPSQLYEVVDTVPGELAFLDLIGQPDHPLPEADGLLHQATRPDDKMDTMVRIARFLFRAAVLPKTGDDEKVAEAFAALYGYTPSALHNNLVADHVQGWIETFWKKELAVSECLREDNAQTIERVRRIVAEKLGHDPGPPESWACELALDVKGLMQLRKDHAAVSLLDDTLTINGSLRTLSQKWGVALDPRPEGWTFSETAAVYQVLVILGDFGANVKEIEPQGIFDAFRLYDVKAVLKQRTKFRKEFQQAAGNQKATAAVVKKAQADRERVQRRRGPGKPNPDQVVAKILKLAGFAPSEDAVRRERGRERARRAGAREQRKGHRRKKRRSAVRRKQLV